MSAPSPSPLPRCVGTSPPRCNLSLGFTHQACSGPADGMKIEVISVDDEPQEVISLDDDESQDTSSQGDQSFSMLVCSIVFRGNFTIERPLFKYKSGSNEMLKVIYHGNQRRQILADTRIQKYARPPFLCMD